MRITGGFLKNRSLRAPKGFHTRPTSEKVRQSVFNICQNFIEDAHFLDLFAGSGAMGIEALSRGAASATFIENNRIALKTIRDNINILDLSSLAIIFPGDVLKNLKNLSGKKFNLIYMDPPYEKGLHENALQLIDEYELLSKEGILFIEELSLNNTDFKNLILKKTRKIGNTFLFEINVKP